MHLGITFFYNCIMGYLTSMPDFYVQRHIERLLHPRLVHSIVHRMFPLLLAYI